MKLGDGITVFATEQARKNWEGKEKPVKSNKSGCPLCDLETLIKHERDSNKAEDTK
jgi:hypothetical protein